MLATTAYDDPDSGEMVILIVNQGIYLGETLENSLLSPNQLRAYGIIVDDIPKHLAPDPNKATQSIRTQDDDFRIPLIMHGVISAFHSRHPTSKELETCHWIVLTSEKEWTPNSNEFAEREEEWVQISNTIELPSPDRSIYALNSEMTDVKHSDLCQQMELKVLVGSVSSKSRLPTEILRNKVAKTLGVGLETAARTIRSTTQLALRQSIHPTHKRFKTRVAQLQYPRLSRHSGKLHTDTFFLDVPSLSNCKMGQLYANDVDFTKFYPMHCKGEASDTLIAFMQDIGIPSGLHSDNANELTEGKMAEILKRVLDHPFPS
jgi:hypothetical protein